MASAALSHVQVQARPRTRGPTPYKLAIAAGLARTCPQVEASQIHWMKVVGDDGGLLTWRSSPHVMWLAARLAARP